MPPITLPRRTLYGFRTALKKHLGLKARDDGPPVRIDAGADGGTRLTSVGPDGRGVSLLIPGDSPVCRADPAVRPAGRRRGREVRRRAVVRVRRRHRCRRELGRTRRAPQRPRHAGEERAGPGSELRTAVDHGVQRPRRRLRRCATGRLRRHRHRIHPLRPRLRPAGPARRPDRSHRQPLPPDRPRVPVRLRRARPAARPARVVRRSAEERGGAAGVRTRRKSLGRRRVVVRRLDDLGDRSPRCPVPGPRPRRPRRRAESDRDVVRGRRGVPRRSAGPPARRRRRAEAGHAGNEGWRVPHPGGRRRRCAGGVGDDRLRRSWRGGLRRRPSVSDPRPRRGVHGALAVRAGGTGAMCDRGTERRPGADDRGVRHAGRRPGPGGGRRTANRDGDRPRDLSVRTSNRPAENRRRRRIRRKVNAPGGIRIPGERRPRRTSNAERPRPRFGRRPGPRRPVGTGRHAGEHVVRSGRRGPLAGNGPPQAQEAEPGRHRRRWPG